MDDVRVRLARDDSLRVCVGNSRVVQADAARLRRLVARSTRARMWLTSPALIFDNGVQALLHDPPPALAEVCVGGEVFALDDPFDAAALKLVVETCSRLASSDLGSGWAGSPLPDELAAALQVHSTGSSCRRPTTTPVSKATRSARPTSSA